MPTNTPLPLESRSASGESDAFDLDPDQAYSTWLDVASGTGTLDVEIQERDNAAGPWFTAGRFTQATGADAERILVQPGHSRSNRIVYTIATGPFTFRVKVHSI